MMKARPTCVCCGWLLADCQCPGGATESLTEVERRRESGACEHCAWEPRGYYEERERMT